MAHKKRETRNITIRNVARATLCFTSIANEKHERILVSSARFGMLMFSE